MCSGVGFVSFVKPPYARPPSLFGVRWSTNFLGENLCISLFGLICGGGIPTAFCSHYWLIGYLDGVTVMSRVGVHFLFYSVLGVRKEDEMSPGGWGFSELRCTFVDSCSGTA